MRIETDRGMSGNSTPRARKRTARFRMTLTARTVGALEPEEQTNIARRSPSPTAGRDLVPKVTTCPHFVRIAIRCAGGAYNPAESLASSICAAKYAGRLSSCRKRLRSNSRPRLALHEVLPLDLRPDGTITVADWVGNAAFHLRPVVDCLAAELKRSGKLGMDETTVRVLDPSRGRTKTGYMWTMVRD